MTDVDTGTGTGTGPAVGGRRPTVVVVGAGFAGFHALRRLERLLAPRDADLVVVNSTDYLLYTPLLPEVATGALDPRALAIPLRQTLRRTRVIPGEVTAVDMATRRVTVRLTSPPTVPPGSGEDLILGFDRLVLAPGSVTRQFDIAGVAQHAHGFKTLTEAVYLRDHLLAQLDRADVCAETTAGRAERRERLTVVAVGAGYTGTEFVAQMQRWLTTVADRWDRTGAGDVRWILVDVASAVLPELGPRLGATALTVLRSRGVEVRLGVTISSASEDSVRLTDGTDIACRTLVWGAGVAASPLIAALGCPTQKGRIIVDDQLRVPGVDHVWAAGDAAAAPDRLLPRAPGPDVPAAVSPPTAQHAQREGLLLARNVAASLGVGKARAYAHRDLGLVADLGGPDAVARPVGIPLSGRLAKLVTRGYHLYAIPGVPNKVRVAAGWALAATLPTQVVQLSAIRDTDALMGTAQHTDLYPPAPVHSSATSTSHASTTQEPTMTANSPTGTQVVTTADQLVDALAAGATDIEVRGSIKGMPMITLNPGVSLRGGTLHFAARGVRLTRDNTVEDVTILSPDTEVAVGNDTAVDDLGTLTLRRVRTRGQVLLLAADAVRGGHVRVEDLVIEAADVRGRSDRPHGFGVDALQGAFTLWNRQADPTIRITADLQGISAGSPATPIRGSGVFLAGHGDWDGHGDGGVVAVSTLRTGAIVTDGGIAPGTPDLISGGVYVISGAEVDTVTNDGPVTTHGPNDMVLDNWGRVGTWTAHAAITSHGPSGIGFVNFGDLGTLRVEAPLETFGPGARGFNVYDGTLATAAFESITTHGDGAIGVQVSRDLPVLQVSGDIRTHGGQHTSLVRGQQIELRAIAVSIQPGGRIGSITIGGVLRTDGPAVTTLEVDGALDTITVTGGVSATGPGSDAVLVHGEPVWLHGLDITAAQGSDIVRATA